MDDRFLPEGGSGRAAHEPGPSIQWMLVPVSPYEAGGPYEIWLRGGAAPSKVEAVQKLREMVGEVTVDAAAPWRGTVTPA